MPRTKKPILNYPIAIRFLGVLMLFCGGFMSLTLIAAVIFKEDVLGELTICSLLTLAVGALMYFGTKRSKGTDLKKREGFFVVVTGWLLMSMLGCLPYLLTGSIDTVTNAWFETMSGFTTTGASILNDIEAMPKSVLLWRSLTQWIGGMGIIVLAVAILPLLGIGSVQLFAAEAPGISPEKISPRIADTAKRLWLLYILLTVSETVLLKLAGMGVFDAINHALTTVSTGGFSTKQASIAHFDSPLIEYIITLFMFLGGTNFILLYFITQFKWKKAWHHEEFRFYSGVVGLFTVIVTIALMVKGIGDPEYSFRTAIFQVISMVTTTGFATADYTAWGSGLTMLFFLLLFTGGCAGSTSGGVKMVRHLILFKIGRTELKRQMHPNAVIPLQVNKKTLPDAMSQTVLGFIISYIIIFAVASMLISSMGISFDTAIGAVATSLGNVGPGISEVSPSYSFFAIPSAAKWILTALMLIGRLEIFTVLLLFSPVFWRRA